MPTFGRISSKKGVSQKHLVTVDTPVLLSTEGVGVVALPQVVEGVEQNGSVTTLALDRGNGSLLLLDTRDTLTVGVTSVRPARLGDDNLLTTTSRGDSLELLQDPVTGVLGDNVAIEESVGVDGNVVGTSTQTRVVDDSNEGVDGDNWTVVTGSLQGRSTLVDVRLDLTNVGLTGVDQLVTDGNGVNNGPTTSGRDGGGQGTDVTGDVADVEDTSEDLLARRQSSQDVRDLVTVDTVKSDEVEALELSQVALDLTGRLTGTITVVRRVGDTLGTSGTRTDAGTRRTRRAGRSGSWSRRRTRDWGGGSTGGSSWSSSGGWSSGTRCNGDYNSLDNILLLVLMVLVSDWLSEDGGGQSGSENRFKQHVSGNVNTAVRDGRDDKERGSAEVSIQKKERF